VLRPATATKFTGGSRLRLDRDDLDVRATGLDDRPTPVMVQPVPSPAMKMSTTHAVESSSLGCHRSRTDRETPVRDFALVAHAEPVVVCISPGTEGRELIPARPTQPKSHVEQPQTVQAIWAISGSWREQGHG
jgi:hypothetical protein